MILPRYKFEPTPIRVQGNKTNLSDLSGRVVDSATGMPIGIVAHSNGRFRAAHSIPGGEIEEEWGPRFDHAIEAVWKEYNKTLPKRDRFVRWCTRLWPALVPFLIAALGGSIGSFITLYLKGSSAPLP